ncbi:MAG: methyltransferase [Saprospiraceae bacterium]|nr:methyltransferase [Saprospiraceae bacterium]MBP9210747.1 methyltransferase [Saprospiraceae bacterium]
MAKSGNPEFVFQEFTLLTDAAVFPVTTDSILIGSWARLDGVERAVDFGCGSGLLALMLAQRLTSGFEVYAFDSDPTSVSLAQMNFERSPWAKDLHCMQWDLGFPMDQGVPLEYNSQDLIICNPPYFSRNVLPASGHRRRSRHQLTFTLENLALRACDLLNSHGRLSVVLPPSGESQLSKAMSRYGFVLQRRCPVIHAPGMPELCCLAEYVRPPADCEFSHLTLFDLEGNKTPEFALLTQEFYP